MEAHLVSAAEHFVEWYILGKKFLAN